MPERISIVQWTGAAGFILLPCVTYLSPSLQANYVYTFKIFSNQIWKYFAKLKHTTQHLDNASWQPYQLDWEGNEVNPAFSPAGFWRCISKGRSLACNKYLQQPVGNRPLPFSSRNLSKTPGNPKSLHGWKRTSRSSPILDQTPPHQLNHSIKCHLK